MAWTQRLGDTSFHFADHGTLLARASPARSGDTLAGIGAASDAERVAAQLVLADLPLTDLLEHPLVPYDEDEVTRLVLDAHDADAFAPIRSLTVGGLREHLLAGDLPAPSGLTPEMVAAVSKLMSAKELLTVAKRCSVVTSFRTTLGLPGRLATRLQPNHPTDDPAGILAAVVDGLVLGCGDAVIGVNPATDRPDRIADLVRLLDDVRQRFALPVQSCVLSHVTTTLGLLEAGAPVDLVFQSVAGTEAANRSFGVDLALLAEAHGAALELGRGANVTYFETGQGSALSAGAHHGLDQQTCEARAYAVARRFDPLLVNTVVGFIGPEYLADGKQIVRAALEDHCCGKLLGLPMGVDACYTNHADADQDDVENLAVLLGAAGCTFLITVPGGDDVMLNYQSLSFQDARAVQALLGLRRAPEFEAWYEGVDTATLLALGP